ncbi:MAG TPA: NO-inducible flavohemoprotein [Rhodocyclaceae bacterium]|nr:NO-inducible flavohemoprotein [Rhodocyclaceae bacterium]
MLSEAVRPYIDASVPVLREHGVAITRHFYTSMFEAHPELLNIFNIGNQANGAQQQSLASAVFAYAANYRNPEALAPVVERIVHKHASVGIKPEHYPIVGKYLLGAIKAVLGDAATPELLAAWAEAYGVLADALIATEKRLYADAGVEAGELRSLVVKLIRQESDNVKSFYLQTDDGKSPGVFQPGQYVSVAITIDGLRQLRQYSLSDAPEQPWWRISVKREDETQPAGRISNWLHENVKMGDTLSVSASFGDFRPVIDGDTPIALLSAGIGITPMVSVLNTLAVRNPNRRILFVHAARHGRHHPLRDDVRAARTKLKALTDIQFYETPNERDLAGVDYQHQGRMIVDWLQLEQLGDVDIYLCGPNAFMQEQWSALTAAGVPSNRIHREVFGPDLLAHLV